MVVRAAGHAPGRGREVTDSARVLTPEALDFVARLHREFDQTRQALLVERAERGRRVLAGEPIVFQAETRDVRAARWQVTSAPPDLEDRRVEITGPVDRKMMINALN